MKIKLEFDFGELIMQYEMALIPEAFDSIQNGNKHIEVRINDKKRQQLKKGDQIVFYKLPESLESTIVDVREIYICSSFRELYSKFPVEEFGYGDQSVDWLCDLTYRYYDKQKEDEFGVMGIQIKLL